jgi:hypothetical protein
MKPSPRFDFPLSVRRQAWEEPADVAPYYDGVFDVTMNHAVTVMFVPDVDQARWPFSLPENPDEVRSEREARLVALAFARYGVTPNDQRQGQEEAFDREWPVPERAALFYVSQAEFDAFSAELARLADGRPSVHSEWEMSEIGNLAVTGFLLSRLLTSPNMARRDLEFLGR